MSNKSIFNNILTIGSEYKNSKGGIGSVLEVYASHFDTFKFVATYPAEKSDVVFYRLSVFVLSLIKICYILINDKNIKIVHIHGSHRGSILRKSIIFFIAKKIFKKVVIYHSHSSELKEFYYTSNFIIKKIIKFLFSQVDLIICLSNQWNTFFLSNFKVKNICILENIVEYPSDPIKTSKEKLTLIKFLFLGLIGNRKGIFDLLSVLKDHKPSFENKTLFLIGGNGEIHRLKSFINKHDLGNLVRYEGWVTGDKKKTLLTSSHVYILPSYNEGLPISILEAMSYGKPIISTDVGGIPEVVKDNINGFLIKPGDKESLYNKMMFFINNPNEIEAMGKASEKIIEPYYADNVIEKLKNIYTNLMKES